MSDKKIRVLIAQNSYSFYKEYADELTQYYPELEISFTNNPEEILTFNLNDFDILVSDLFAGEHEYFQEKAIEGMQRFHKEKKPIIVLTGADYVTPPKIPGITIIKKPIRLQKLGERIIAKYEEAQAKKSGKRKPKILFVDDGFKIAGNLANFKRNCEGKLDPIFVDDLDNVPSNLEDYDGIVCDLFLDKPEHIRTKALDLIQRFNGAGKTTFIFSAGRFSQMPRIPGVYVYTKPMLPKDLIDKVVEVSAESVKPDTNKYTEDFERLRNPVSHIQLLRGSKPTQLGLHLAAQELLHQIRIGIDRGLSRRELDELYTKFEQIRKAQEELRVLGARKKDTLRRDENHLQKLRENPRYFVRPR